MKTKICEMLGMEFPILAFTHCRDVVAAVTRAGGYGVLGAAAHTPDQLDRSLWRRYRRRTSGSSGLEISTKSTPPRSSRTAARSPEM